MSFNNEQEWELPPSRPIAEEVFRWGTEKSNFLANGGVKNSDNDPMKWHGVKRASIFFLLPYWKVRAHSNCCFEKYGVMKRLLL